MERAAGEWEVVGADHGRKLLILAELFCLDYFGKF